MENSPATPRAGRIVGFIAIALIACVGDAALAADSSLANWTYSSVAPGDTPADSAATNVTPSQGLWSSLNRGYKPPIFWSDNAASAVGSGQPSVEAPSAGPPYAGPPYAGPPYAGQPSVGQPVESTWYTRIDYFHWNERAYGINLVNEGGALYTLGYTRSDSNQRFRIEFFGGQVHYAGGAQFSNGASIPLSSHTNYYGGRIEYDVFFHFQQIPNLQFFIGIGTRVWNRDLPSSIDQGYFVQGYQETWVTVYPYIGLETLHDPTRAIEFYNRTRLGVTAFTYNYAALDPNTGLYPRCGVTALFEEGIRAGRFSLAGYFEVFGWGQSAVHNDYLQPTSTMLTVGVKAGFSY